MQKHLGYKVTVWNTAEWMPLSSQYNYAYYSLFRKEHSREAKLWIMDWAVLTRDGSFLQPECELVKKLM